MNARGFTLLELVVAITISSIVLIFVSMFLAAPVDAYDAHARRNALVSDASTAWPRMEADLRQALPNSLRARRNGALVALEMLSVVDEARYLTPTNAAFTTAGVFRGVALPFNSNTHYLSVNNLGTPGADAYAPGATLTAAGSTIDIVAGPLAGETTVQVTPPAAFTGVSPRRRIYLVSGPVTYLCDEGQGTLRRYSNYPIAASQGARDTPGEFAALGAVGTLIAQGLSSCDFAAPPNATQAQTVAARLTTTRNGESIALLHSVRLEYVP